MLARQILKLVFAGRKRRFIRRFLSGIPVFSVGFTRFLCRVHPFFVSGIPDFRPLSSEVAGEGIGPVRFLLPMACGSFGGPATGVARRVGIKKIGTFVLFSAGLVVTLPP